MPIKMADVVGIPPLIPNAVIIPVNAMTEPTDRSMPPLMMIIVMPMAPIATITVCAKTVRRFFSERYFSGSPMRIAKIRITRIKPRTRNFPRNCNRASAYAANTPIIKAMIVTQPPMTTPLNKDLPNLLYWVLKANL